MPRDLEQERGNVWKGIAQLEKSPDEIPQSEEWSDMSSEANSTSPEPHHGFSASRENAIKPYTQALNMLDLPSCVKLEEMTFPPEERCSEEKFEYRFTKCGELSLGLFTSADTTVSTASSHAPTNANPGSADTAATAVPVYSGTPDRKSILLGHIIATKTTNELVRDEDMELPPDWRAEHAKSISSPSIASPPPQYADRPSSRGGARPGHKEEGRTLCIHSLSILPAFQGKGLGRLLLKAYIQRMQGSGVADRISIISHENLVPFYMSMGFENKGKSPVQYGGGGWTDLSLEIKQDPDD